MPDSRKMNVRNSSGRQVSILNDDDDSYPSPLTLRQLSGRTASSSSSSSGSFHHGGSYYGSGSSDPPELLRSSSYDSQASADLAISPLTPSAYWDGGRNGVYSAFEDYVDAKQSQNQQHQQHNLAQVASAYGDNSSNVGSPGATGPEHAYGAEDEYAADANQSNGVDGGGQRIKRYPCRFAEELGCDKTFTTSGHASRHSKIHTSEKSIQCPHEGCQKKFTRSDNMKQHYDTHTKEKPSKSSSSGSGSKHHHSREHHHSSGRHHSHNSTSSGLDALAAACAADV